MSRRLKLLLIKALVIFHIGCMIVYTGRVLEFIPNHKVINAVRHIVTTYSKVTMTNYRFAFFAPFIPPYYTVDIYGETKDGRFIRYRLPQPNREIEIRYNRMLRNIPKGELRGPMFKSWANYIKSRHPEIDSVIIRVFETNTPSMEEFRAGKKKEMKMVYNLKL